MGLSTPIVGRESELARLEAALAAVGEGESPALAVVGPAGIGKSRLLADLIDRAGAAGHIALGGAASELEQDLPFGVFVNAMDDHLESLPAHRLARLEDTVSVELARVFPALSNVTSDASPATQDERYRTHRAVRTLLETLATKPLVLVLDDLHWADSGSIELVSALLRRPPSGRVLLVLGFRPRQLPERVLGELTRAGRDGSLTEVVLPPLQLPAVREMLGGSLADAEMDSLFKASGGVPFYIEQLARSSGDIREGSGPPLAALDSALDSVPPGVLAALNEELALLSEQAREVLAGAAVAGDPFDLEMAAVAAERSYDAAIDGLDEMLGLDFVRATSVPRRFSFRHPLVRRAVYESASAGWRLLAHERCAAALAVGGASAEARAHHVERSAGQGDATAITLLREASREAADRAPGTAARWLEVALRLLPDNAPAEDRTVILSELARSLGAVGRLKDSCEALEECLRLSTTANPAQRADAVARCARSQRFIGQHADANQSLTAALDEAGADSRERVVILLELAIDGFYGVAFESMFEWAERALAGASALGDGALVAAAHSMLALAGAWTGDLTRFEGVVSRAGELVDALSDDDLAIRLDAAANLAAAELYMDMFADAGRHAQRVLQLGRQTNQGELFPAMYAVLGTSMWMDGRLQDAYDLLDGAVEAARLLEDNQGIAWTLLNRAAAALQLGDCDGAQDAGEESVELTTDAESGLIKGLARVWLGMAHLEGGRPEQSIKCILSAGGEALDVVPGGWRTVYLEALCRARIETGDLAGARRSANQTRNWADHVGLPFPAAMAARSEARVALAERDVARAADAALASVNHAERAGARLETARSRAFAGRCLTEAGDTARALVELEQAATDLSCYGAKGYLDAAEQDLRRLGAHVVRRARPRGEGLGALTPREVEVARLTVDRMTNREIAARLFLSEKTVESHMRNLFHKLDVASRVDVARAMERADRVR